MSEAGDNFHDAEDAYQMTARTKLKRYAKRAVYDREAVHAILDEAFLCHVAYVHEGQPYAMPMAYGRVGDKVYMHGSITNRMLKSMKGGVNVCLTVTIVDGLVLARSGFHHDINTRSVMALGQACIVSDAEEKSMALDAIIDHAIPGRAADLGERQPTKSELNATAVLALQLDEVSAKVRVGSRTEDEERDISLPIWAGVLPLQQNVASVAIPDPDMPHGTPTPSYVSAYSRNGAHEWGGPRRVTQT
ncbi:hypothetical protein WJX73_004684 [Symbiochloris irregularis]|uniref:Flavin-nucleotide-binding protein n=1 Tax=Symbiochloris irregularis TaxID=706552 RepID=A0AAW1NP91_9CHLO